MEPPQRSSTPDAVAAAQVVPAGPRSPRSRRELPTTAAEIALGNLESQLAGAVRAVDGAPTPRGLAQLASLYLAHGQIVGRIDEYERAEALAERALKEAPGDPAVLLAHAAARSTFHRFDEALADVERASRAGADGGADPGGIDRQRAAIFQAVGRFAAAGALRERLVARHPTIDSLGALATLDGDEGRLDEAERHFADALDRFADVSPFPVAWLWLQEGTMWQREGRPARARELLAAAVDRLPQLAPAVGHLASVMAEQGEAEAAIERLRSLSERSDDPEYEGQLAALLVATGRADEGAKRAAHARARFEVLLAAHPAAFADHAARFFLGPGNDAKRAVALADRNFGARPTAEAARLLLDAATAAGDPARACDAAERAVALAPASVTMHHAAWRAFSACNRPERAAAVLLRAEGLAKTR